MSSYLSKSDYKVAHDCYTKLFYKKKEYPSIKDTNEYLKFLAQGGYMVGKLATLYFPEGIEISTGNDHNLAVELTEKNLEKENVILFEASILSKSKLIRIDVLKKENKTLHLIEVKSKSYDPEEKLDTFDYRDYLFDVGFQYYVLKEKYPDYKIIPYLFMPDKSKVTKLEGLPFLFDIKENNSDSRFRSYNITIPANKTKDLVNDNLLTLINVEEYVLKYLPIIEQEVKTLLPSLSNDIAKVDVPLSKKCFKCEYSVQVEKTKLTGFDECWVNMPKPLYHLKELTRIYPSKAVKEMDSLIQQKKVSFDDIVSLLGDGKGDNRRKIQIEYTKRNEEFIDPLLKRELDLFKYPLHFIDFETSRTALPYHKGMRPYEQVTFQWSCHTIKYSGAELIHGEWLNLEKDFPNFKFAEELMKYINSNGGVGTPLMWSHYENTTLRDIYIQMLKYDYQNAELKNWLETVIKFRKRKDEDPVVPDRLCETEGRFVDLNALANQFYFHPLMKNKTSIKWVLPAVLNSINSDRIKMWLENFTPEFNLYEVDQNGIPKDPYELLKPPEIFKEAERLDRATEDDVYINEGTGAMRAYEDLMIGLNKGNEEIKLKYKEALLRYCKLDTLAMVIIWEYWNNLTGR